MEFKNLIDKSMKLRLNIGESQAEFEARQVRKQRHDGWNAPFYSESRAVDLNLLKLQKNRCVCLFPEAPEQGYYRVLRTHIMHLCQANNWNTIMITSSVPGEGKTLTAINLAATFAWAHGQTVLLVDCDLQRQNIHRYLGVQSPKGLADYLHNGTPLKDLIIWPGVEKLTFISGGKPVHDSSELISSPRMAELATEMKTRYSDRYIFYDLPPLLAEADAMAFAPLADGILMVVHPKTSFSDIQKALDLLPKEKLLGLVLNRVEAENDDYYYRYRYGYGKYGKHGKKS